MSVFHVGWLEASYPYPQGQASPRFIKALRRLCRHPVAMYKGHHVCDFCGAKPRTKVHPPLSGLEHIYLGEDISSKGAIEERLARWSQRLRTMVARPREMEAMAGSYDIEVVGKDAVYRVPGLILHYIEEHNYLPPQEFIEAVLAAKPRRVPRDPDGTAGRLGFTQDDHYTRYWYWPLKREPDAQGLVEYVFIFRHERHAQTVQSELAKLGRSCMVGEMNLEEWVRGKVSIQMGRMRITCPADRFPPLTSAFYLHAFAKSDEMFESIEGLEFRGIGED